MVQRKWLAIGGLMGLLLGCGTTRWSDTQRTATEQLLISDAIDRAVSRFDFQVLSGKRVYLDATAAKATIDAAYLASSLRQQMFAQGCVVMDRREDAQYIVEVRTGALGTDHREVLFGIPATKMPEGLGGPSIPAAIPEIPFAKKTEQRAVAKVALFAYNRETGRPVWQSGTMPVESKVKDLWVLGAGPFQRGSIVKGKKLSSDSPWPLGGKEEPAPVELSATREVVFPEPKQALASVIPPAVSKEKKDAVIKADKPAAKPVDPSPLDEVVPAAHVEQPPVTSGPAAGMDGFWASPPGIPPAAPAAAAQPTSIQNAVPQVLPTISGRLRELPLHGKNPG